MPKHHDTVPSLALTHLRRRTVVGLLRTWRGLTGSARHAITGEVRPSLPKEDVDHLRDQMRACLHSKGGEISARANTVGLGKTYLQLNEAGRAKFLRVLAEDFDLDRAALQLRLKALHDAFQNNGKPAAHWMRLEHDLRAALIAPRSIILRQFNALPDGFKFLVDMRSDLLPLLAKSPTLQGLDYDMKHILSAWFDVGLLDLVEIDWNSPAAVLEKLIAYEAVHKVRSWEDLKNRLDADRRVYGFFHNKMPHEPLIFVHVALMRGMADNVQALLDVASPLTETGNATTAVFYSISSAQKGLAGISLGNFLIKRVVDALAGEMKQLRHFCTLSPIPGLRDWLTRAIASTGPDALPAPLRAELALMFPGEGGQALDALEAQAPGDPAATERVKQWLFKVTAHYLLDVKRKTTALDPVAHFHLSNGARLERLNWRADMSPKGVKQAFGIMVNYYYALDEIDDNHETYVRDGKIAASRGIRALLS